MSLEEQVEDRGHKPQSYSPLVIGFHVMMHALPKPRHQWVQAMRILYSIAREYGCFAQSSVPYLLHAPIGDPC